MKMANWCLQIKMVLVVFKHMYVAEGLKVPSIFL